jgi:CTP:molybdopterin cytidylyltransferase MocA
MAHQDAVSGYSAIITAGGQADDDLASVLGVREKCAGSVGGNPMVWYSVEAVLGAGVSQVVVVCGPEVREALGTGAWEFADPGSNPVDSARKGAARIPPERHILFLPADLPLIKADHVARYVQELPESKDAWLSAATAYEHAVEAKYGSPPGMQYMTVRPVRHAASGLFAGSRPGFEKAVTLLSDLAGDRKSQLRMARRFGFLSVLRYFAGLMTVEAAEKAAGRLFGCHTHLITGCAPETVLDVDTVSDYEFVMRAYPATAASSST